MEVHLVWRYQEAYHRAPPDMERFMLRKSKTHTNCEQRLGTTYPLNARLRSVAVVLIQQHAFLDPALAIRPNQGHRAI